MNRAIAALLVVFALSAGAQQNVLPPYGSSRPPCPRAIADIGRLAATNGITIYALQPAFELGDAIRGPDISKRGAGGSGSAHDISSELNENETTMSTLAVATGGKWFRGDARVPETFRQVAEDVGKPRRVEVRVKGRPELVVRARREVANGAGHHQAAARQADLRHDGERLPRPLPCPLRAARRESRLQLDAIARAGHRCRGRGHGEDARTPLHVRDEPARAAGRYRIAVGVFDPVSRLSSFETLTVDAR